MTNVTRLRAKPTLRCARSHAVRHRAQYLIRIFRLSSAAQNFGFTSVTSSSTVTSVASSTSPDFV